MNFYKTYRTKDWQFDLWSDSSFSTPYIEFIFWGKQQWFRLGFLFWVFEAYKKR